MKPGNILILPGWQNSSAGHWQTVWEEAHGYRRVEQHDWLHPRRGDWMARLEEVLLGCDEPAVLVAHSLGCLLTAAWASHSHHTGRVKAALLVAPPDIEREDIRELLPTWFPPALQKLPFETVVYASSDDPFCGLDRARRFADAWGAAFVDAGPHGHVNAESRLGHWPPAHQELLRMTHISA
ncbi:MAG: serine hydrolase family protein [Comamonadaceae bacterium]|nr:MAG: serine hydrolase family protein [Comamonadaceae bacterium]